MPTLMPSDTKTVLGINAEKCESRSLLLDRFVYDHPKMNEARKLHFAQVCANSFDCIRKTRAAWEVVQRDPKAKNRHEAEAFLEDTQGLARRTGAVGLALCEREGRRFCPKADAHILFISKFVSSAKIYAQLQARLMVNMAGGVMENGGLCIDRFGLPYIPGSAIKGCARREATRELLEAQKIESKAEIMLNLCLIFGWTEADWKRGRKRKRKGGQEAETEPHSDLWWAMALDTDNRKADDRRRNEMWNQVAPTVARRLLDRLRVQVRKHPQEPWLDLPNYGGSISFLPAYPIDLGRTGAVDGLPIPLPQLGQLELDVVTCHHREYYASSDPNAKATDTEEPVPVVFPAVSPGHVFVFALVPLRRANSELLDLARHWLQAGLETFGVGAKTNAGYGWFTDVTDTLQHMPSAKHAGSATQAVGGTKAQRQAPAQAPAEAEQLANAPPHEKFRAEYAKLADEPFATQAKKYAEMTDEQRHGFVLALKERRETAKRWIKKKPDLIKPWQEFAKKLQPPVELP